MTTLEDIKSENVDIHNDKSCEKYDFPFNKIYTD